MSSPLREKLGALQERDFRLLFAATTTTTAGDRLAGIALAFAVLDFGSATDLGVVLGVRQAVEALVLVFGGVLSIGCRATSCSWGRRCCRASPRQPPPPSSSRGTHRWRG
jgi:hypothetical protein